MVRKSVAEIYDEIAVDWTCPHCGTDNRDIEGMTAVPMCSGCGENVFWSEIRQGEVVGYVCE
jgi:ribosomal protein L37AE/L43A